LVAKAPEYPEINFLGIDRVEKWMKIGREKSLKRKVENLKFIKQDARLILEGLPPGAVSVFHIYFPDPWPKRRHRPRRIVNGVLFNLLYRCLLAGGFVEIATDDADYFTAIRKAVQSGTTPWTKIRESINERINSPALKTNYELKYEAAGKNLYYLELEK
ncbi:MAG: hypothetical protein HYZ84_03395, partial [Candidatus Omnitrophica bacterium]|nr:hypothetical protein [Candidatus Omnitrophota bacterium]